MVHGRDPLRVRSQNKKVIKRKPRPQWDSSINDVSSMKVSKSEVEKRTKLYSAKHMEKIRNEIKAMQRKEKTLQTAIHSSPFVAHNRSIVVQEADDAKTKLQELLNETDRKMAEAKDLFGDHGYKYRVIPNVTSAPCFKHSPITLTRTVVEDSPSPPTALNDTQKLGVVTVETLPPDTTALDLTRIRLLLDQEKENCLLTAQNTLLNSTSLHTGNTGKINKVLDFNEDIPSVRMGDRSRRKVKISDSDQGAVAATSESRDRSIWSPVPVEIKANQVVMSTKPEKRDSSFESSPPRLRESSSESLVSPSRIKKQQSLEKRNRIGKSGSPSKEDKTRTPDKTSSPENSPIRITAKNVSPRNSGPAANSVSQGNAPQSNAPQSNAPQSNAPQSNAPQSNAPKGNAPLGNCLSEHHYPPVLKIPAIKEDLDVESHNEDGTEEEVDPIRGSRNPSGRKASPRNKLVNTATSPVPTSSPRSCKQTHSIATSPVRGLETPVKGHEEEAASEKKEADRSINLERESYDRHYTDQELKDRLEHLIVGGHYPFAKVEQKSYAIADPDARQEGKNTEKEVGTWIRANFANDGDNLTFVDSSPLKGAALDLELKLRKYQSQIGAQPTKSNTSVGGFSGYTSLLLRSVSTMIGYLTEQESNTVDERSMRSEVIETMTALQNTVETLSSELLSCRKDLSETKQKVQTMEQDYSSTLMFLIDNCVLKDPSLQTPLNAQRVKQLPTVISPFTTTPPAPPLTTTPDLMTFTPHPNKSEDLMEFTPAQPAHTDALVQITPETSDQYLQFLEEKTEQLRSGLNAKLNEMNNSADNGNISMNSVETEKSDVTSEDKSLLSAPNKSNMSTLNFSNLTEDGLDLSQDLDALIDRLKQMNAQTLAVTSQQMGLTPRKTDAKVDESLNNIKDMLDIEQAKPLEAATRVIESYKRQSDFSPSQLLPDFQGSTPISDTKQLESSNELTTHVVHPTEVSPVMISPPDVVRAPGRISGEYIGSFSGNKPVADRPVTPNPLSPRRVQEEIKRSTPDEKNKASPPKEHVPVSPNTSECPPNHLEMSPPITNPGICRSSSSILQSPSAFSPPTKETPSSPQDPSSTDSSPKQDKTALINEFLSHNPHYLKKISESLTSASLPSFPTSPPPVSTATATSSVSQDDGLPNDVFQESEKSPVVKSTINNSGVTEAVVRGSVTKNIAKFEKKLEEAEQERERSISPKRSPSRRGKMAGRGSGRPRSALSPERKAGSPERKVKHRVSWGDDQIVQESPPPTCNKTVSAKSHTKTPAEILSVEEESEIVMKPDRSQLPERRKPDKAKKIPEKTTNERKIPEHLTNDRRVPEKNVKERRDPGKKTAVNGSHQNGGSTASATEVKTQEPKNSQQQQRSDNQPAGNGELKSSGSDLMAQLMSMNDAKLTELVTTLNKLTER